MYMKSFQKSKRKDNHPPKKWAIDISRQFTKEKLQADNKHMRKRSASLETKDMQIKSTMSVGNWAFLYPAGGHLNWCNLHGGNLAIFIKSLKNIASQI